MANIFYQNKTEYESDAIRNGIIPYNERNIWGKLLYAVIGINFPRGYSDTCTEEVWINQDAFYFGERDKDLLIRHELGHIEGKEHTLFGLMCSYGLLRYITTWE